MRLKLDLFHFFPKLEPLDALSPQNTVNHSIFILRMKLDDSSNLRWKLTSQEMLYSVNLQKYEAVKELDIFLLSLAL